MERIKAFYPALTEKIIHHGRTGNEYRLDAIDQPVRIKESLEKDSRFEVITITSKDDSVLFLTHSQKLINAYKKGEPKELSESSGIEWQEDFYPWVVNKAGATIEAAKEAIKSKRSLTITSGGHHAEYDKGRGFGPISNMVIAAKKVLDMGIVDKVAILDMDVHFANGTNSQVVDDKRILSCDLWKYRLNYWKYTPNTKNVFHKKVQNEKIYLTYLDLMLDRIKLFKPGLIFVYNGLDVLDKDRMGGIKGFTEETLFTRNNRVADFIMTNRFPICVFIGGGYIDYSQSQDKIKKDKEHLTSLFMKSSFAIFGL